MRNQILIPTVAEFSGDLKKSWEIGRSLTNIGYDYGLMLVIRKGKIGISPKVAAQQYQNLIACNNTLGPYGDRPIVTMLSNLPIEEIDFYHHEDQAADHVRQGIEFVKNLPFGGRRILTFHLNTLMNSEELAQKTPTEWRYYYRENIHPTLSILASLAETKGVELKIETVPDPEFGDVPASDKRRYQGVPLRDLRNPFLLHATTYHRVRGNIGICLDLCHNRTLHPSSNQLLGDVLALEETDLVHLNDGADHWTSNGGCFKEGVALGKGDIECLPRIIKLLNERKIPMVLEVNETDFNTRPNTMASIAYLASLQS